MADLDAGWKLRGGPSQFFRRSEVRLTLREPPLRLDWESAPWQLVSGREPLVLNFEVARALTVRGPGPLRWRLDPALKIRARFLRPGQAFLGNFRVPRQQTAVEWRIEGSADAAVAASSSQLLAGVDHGSRVTLTWVVIADRDRLLEDALRSGWSGFVDPFDPATAARLDERRVIRLAWTGKVALRASIAWRLISGWSLARQGPLARWRGEAGQQLGAEAAVRLQRRGRFSMLLSRRSGVLRLNVGRDRETDTEMSFRLESLWAARHRPALRQPLDPAAEPVRRRLSGALRRQIGLALAVEAGGGRRRRQVLRARWKDSDSGEFAHQYRSLLRGHLPAVAEAEAGFELESELDLISSRRFSVEVNFFNWLRFSEQRSSEERVSIRTGGDGAVTIERSYRAQRLRRWRDHQQLLALAIAHLEGERPPLSWSGVWSGRLNRAQLKNVLRAVLHAGLVDEFRLPAYADRPATQVLWKTRFSPQGVDAVLAQSRSRLRRSLIRALELAHPGLYAEGGWLRDWIDSEQLREGIVQDPAQIHLASRYPLSGRSYHRRVQNVAAGRRSDSFLELMQEWSRGDLAEVVGKADRLLKIPTFIFFHLACPLRHRSSGLIVAGPVNGQWGDDEILAELAGRPNDGEQ